MLVRQRRVREEQSHLNQYGRARYGYRLEEGGRGNWAIACHPASESMFSKFVE